MGTVLPCWVSCIQHHRRITAPKAGGFDFFQHLLILHLTLKIWIDRVVNRETMSLSRLLLENRLLNFWIRKILDIWQVRHKIAESFDELEFNLTWFILRASWWATLFVHYPSSGQSTASKGSGMASWRCQEWPCSLIQFLEGCLDPCLLPSSMAWQAVDVKNDLVFQSSFWRNV